MGQIVSYFMSTGRMPSEFSLDLQDGAGAEIPPADRELHGQMADLLRECDELKAILSNYRGNQEAIRAAMSAPKDRAKQVHSFNAMLPNIRHIKRFYETGKQMEELVSRVVKHLFVGEGDMGAQQALLKQLAAVLMFSLQFDQKKMLCPSVQNDFSFYRRSLGKMSRQPNIPVTDIEANSISMFVAQATPMIFCLKTTLTNLNRQSPQVASFLGQIANICCATFMRSKNEMDAETANFLLSSMTVSLVLYDDCARTGVFKKNADVSIKNCIQQIRTMPPEQRNPLLNILQYSTRTFKTAPESIRKLITAA